MIGESLLAFLIRKKIARNQHFDLPNSEERILIGDFGSPLQRPQTRESHRQAEANELWDGLKAETGYSSYADYLEAYNGKRPYLQRVLYQSVPGRYDMCGDRNPKFTILDLSSDEISWPQVVPCYDSTSASSIVPTLRQPLAKAAVQIMLWSSTSGYLNDDVMNARGQGSKIDPRFFGALGCRNRRHFDHRHVTIGGAVASIMCRYHPDRVDPVPSFSLHSSNGKGRRRMLLRRRSVMPCPSSARPLKPIHFIVIHMI